MYYILRAQKNTEELIPKKTVNRLEQLWKVAQKAMVEKKFDPAERALLTILKIDHKNAAAYNRLGILYARQKNYPDAVDCFKIAGSLEPKASNYHNLGLIFYEMDKLEDAETAFSQALDIEPLATRHIAMAKVQQKQNNKKGMVASLEAAVELESNPQNLQLLSEGYFEIGNEEKYRNALSRLEKMNSQAPVNPKLKQPSSAAPVAKKTAEQNRTKNPGAIRRKSRSDALSPMKQTKKTKPKNIQRIRKRPM